MCHANSNTLNGGFRNLDQHFNVTRKKQKKKKIYEKKKNKKDKTKYITNTHRCMHDLKILCSNEKLQHIALKNSEQFIAKLFAGTARIHPNWHALFTTTGYICAIKSRSIRLPLGIDSGVIKNCYQFQLLIVVARK